MCPLNEVLPPQTSLHPAHGARPRSRGFWREIRRQTSAGSVTGLRSVLGHRDSREVLQAGRFDMHQQKKLETEIQQAIARTSAQSHEAHARCHNPDRAGAGDNDDTQRANGIESVLQQVIQTVSSISKSLYDAAVQILRNVRG